MTRVDPLAALTLAAGKAVKRMTAEFYWCRWSLERPIKSDQPSVGVALGATAIAPQTIRQLTD